MASDQPGLRIKIKKRPLDEDEKDNKPSVKRGPSASRGRYKPSDEAFPSLPAFDARLDPIKQQTISLLRQVHGKLTKYAARSPILQNMHSRAAEAMAIPEVEPPKIALMGDAGDGKSSTINSLTDIPKLAATGGTGFSCTNVPTLYMHKLPGQKLEFAAKICYSAVEMCRQKLNGWLDDYRRFTRESDEDWDMEQKAEYDQNCETAIRSFRNLFATKTEFASRSAAEKTLSTECEQGEGKLIEAMMRWCESFFLNLENTDGAAYIYRDAQNTTELQVKLSEFISETPRPGKSCFWPLIKEICVGCPASRLLNYVTLVDLPGTTDTDSIKGGAAAVYMRECQALWYVSDIKRAIINSSLDLAVRVYAERFSKTLAVILTKIDIVDENLADTMRAKGEMEDAPDALTTDIAEMITNVNNLRNLLPDPYDEPESDDEAQRDLRKQLMMAEYQLQLAESAQDEAAVKARNNACIRKLRIDKGKYLPAEEDLQVFCCSNTHYNARTGVSRLKTTPLSAELTGIPNLRSYALGLAAPALWQAALEQTEYTICLMFRGLQLWTNNAVVGDRDSLLDVLRDLQSQSKVPFAGLKEQHRKSARDCLTAKLLAGQETTQTKALMAITDFKPPKVSAPSFLAIYRRGGDYRTPAMGKASWNEIFIEHQTAEIFNPNWYPMVESLHKSVDKPVNEVIARVQEASRQIQRLPAAVSLNSKTVRDMLQAVEVGIQTARTKSLEVWKEGHRTVHMNMSKDQNSNYFTIAMKPVYDEGRKERGVGVVASNRGYLHKHLNLELSDAHSPFSASLHSFDTALTQVNQVHTTTLQNRIAGVLQEILTQFDELTRKKKETPHEAVARVDLKKFLATAMPEVERMEVIQAIKKQYPLS